MYFLRYVMSAVLLFVMMDAAGAIGQTGSARTLSGDELVRIGEIHDVQNHYREALTYYEQALDAFRAHHQRQGEAIVLTKIGSMYERQGRRREAAVQLRQAVALFSKSPHSPVHADALYALGRVSLWVGSREDAARRFEQAKDRYRRSGDQRALGAVMLDSGLLKVSDASSDEGLRDIQHVLDSARARGDDDQTLTATVALADANWILDRTGVAAAEYEEALSLLERRPQAPVEAKVRLRLAALEAAAAKPEEGIKSAKRSLTLSQSLRDPSGEAASWALLASLYEASHQRSEAEEALQRALAMYGRQQMTIHAFQSAPAAASAPKESQSPARP